MIRKDESRDCHVIVTCLPPLNPTSPLVPVSEHGATEDEDA